MSEGGEGRPEVGGPEDLEINTKVIADFAKVGLSQLRHASMSYTGIRDLFKPNLPDDQMEPAELTGSDWKWKFIRRPTKKGIDIEIRKFPLSGQNLVEHAVRLRTGENPLVRTDRVLREAGPESLENDDEAIAEAGAFIKELLRIF